MTQILRRLRGALSTALAWGTLWFGGGVVYSAVGFLFSRTLPWRLFLDQLIPTGVAFAAIGFVTGAVFSLYVASALRHKRLEDLSPVGFALRGALVSVVLMLTIMSAVSGFAFLLEDLVEPIILAATLGGVTSFGSIKLAKAALEPGDAPAGELEAGSE